jgi:hypothetical protein
MPNHPHRPAPSGDGGGEEFSPLAVDRGRGGDRAGDLLAPQPSAAAAATPSSHVPWQK